MRTRLYRKEKLVFGVGINDADYPTNPTENGKRQPCPYYQRRCLMLERGHGEKYKEKYPTYKDVSVCKQWHVFTNFKAWMEKQDWEGKELDKDILFPGNKVYSPETCCFVSKDINYLMIHPSQKRSGLLTGVCNDKNGRFASYISEKGKQRRIGRFDTETEAYRAYIKAKVQLIESYINGPFDEAIKIGLRKHAQCLRDTLIAKGEIQSKEQAA